MVYMMASTKWGDKYFVFWWLNALTDPQKDKLKRMQDDLALAKALLTYLQDVDAVDSPSWDRIRQMHGELESRIIAATAQIIT